MKKKCVFLALAAVSAATAALADKVTLKSGSTLTGAVVGASASELTFKADDFGEVKIPVANIVALEDAGTHTILYVDRTQETKALSVKGGAYQADGCALDMAGVKEIDPVAETWHGSVNGAFNAARGNTVENSWSVLASVNRRWEKDRFNASFGCCYSEKGAADAELEKSTDRWESEAQHDHFWLPAVYHYENLRYDRDAIQLLDARYRVGLGAGYQWLDGRVFFATGKWSFNQEAGVNWVKECYKDNDDAKGDGFAALRYAHHLTYLPKWNEGVEAFHNAEVLPDVSDWEKYLVKADIGFTTKLVYDLDLLAKIEWEFDSTPANDRKKSDVRYLVGLGYKW